jgi:hypothetical protein
MKTINYQTLKSITHAGVILSTIVFSCEIEAGSIPEKGSLERDDYAGTRARKLSGNSVDEKKGIHRPEQIEESEIVAKCKDKYAGRSKDKKKTRSKPSLNELENRSRVFEQTTRELRVGTEEDDRKVSNRVKTVLNALSDVADGIINGNVESESSRSSFLKAKDKLVDAVKSLFD